MLTQTRPQVDARAEELAARLDRARAYLAIPAGPGNYFYHGQTRTLFVASTSPAPGGIWTVENGRCNCPDAQLGYAGRNLGGACKHVALEHLLYQPVRIAAALRKAAA